jgi:hypothetical protein
LLAKIYSKSLGRKDTSGSRGLHERAEDMYDDKHNLYVFARTTAQARQHGQLAGKGSWERHQIAANNLKAGLQNDIREFDERECNKYYRIPYAVRSTAIISIPSKPGR